MPEITHYGDWYVGGEIAERTTIHGTGGIDVVVDPVTKEVLQVWFRCLNLPFVVHEAEPNTVTPINPLSVVTAIEYFAP